MTKLTCDLPLNFEGLLELDSNFGGTPNWVAVSVGITNIQPANNDVVDQKQYRNGLGHGSSDVTGMQNTYAVSADRVLTDAAQNFVLGLRNTIGCSRITQCKVTLSDGNLTTFGCTIANIAPPGGDSASKGAWSFEIHANGKPVVTPATTAPALSAVISAGSVVGSTSFAATAGEGNTLAYLLTAAVPTTPNAGAYVDILAYTTTNNIPAVIGNVLNMLELDANGRVVKYLSDTLEAADINPGT